MAGLAEISVCVRKYKVSIHGNEGGTEVLDKEVT